MAASVRFELTHVRVKVWCLTTWLRGKLKWWREMDSNHRTQWEQIYSLSRLASSLPLQKNGAETRTWTRNLLITSQLLYQLSYFGINKWWAIQDSNLWPLACKASALTNWANRPNEPVDSIKYTNYYLLCQLNLWIFLFFFCFYCI